VELAMGGYGVEGGMYQLVRLLARAAERVGATIRCDSPVSQVVVVDGQVRGVELSRGGMVEARRVVANADVAHLIKRLLPQGIRHGISQAGEPSMSGYNMVFKAERKQDDERRVAHTVAFCEDYEQEFADIFDKDRPPVDPTVYLCAQEVCHGRAGWADHEALFVMANAPAQPLEGAHDAAAWPLLESAVVDRLMRERLIGAGDQVVWRRNPQQLADRFWDSRGSIYGLASNGPTAAFQRPPNRVARIGGLFLASGGAHPGGGVPLAALSGRAAARAALQMSA
jgi:phytoene dehydrogenase-like protein